MKTISTYRYTGVRWRRGCRFYPYGRIWELVEAVIGYKFVGTAGVGRDEQTGKVWTFGVGGIPSAQ